MNLTNFKWDQDADGIVRLVWDMPGRSMNVVSTAAIKELGQAVAQIASDASIKVVKVRAIEETRFTKNPSGTAASAAASA